LSRWKPNSTSSGSISKSWAEKVSESASAPIIRTRDQAEAFLDDRIGQGVKPGLERIAGLLEFMGDPQNAYPTIHIAGTNGKTTLSRMVQQILGAHGLATAGFTSPHLHTVEERFTLHGVTIDSRDFTDAVADIAWFVEAYEQQAGTSTTYFEVTAALAFSVFATAAVDVAVIEVGLGGRLDATNVLSAAVVAITGIDIDHTDFLGTTIDEIATEKAAIVGESGTLVTGVLPTEAEMATARRIDETGANWIRTGKDFEVVEADVAVGGWHCSVEGVFGRYDDLYLPIHGRHQVDHLATAIATSEMFLGRELDHEALAFAVGSISAPGRLEVVGRRPLVIVDGAHNAQGFRGLAETLVTEFPAMKWQLVLGVRGKRDVAELVSPLRGLVEGVFATAPEDPGAIHADLVADAASESLAVPVVTFPGVLEAVRHAAEAAGEEGGVVVAGSLYLIGEVRGQYEALSDRSPDVHVRVEAEREVYPEHDYDDDPTD
jgi:dihydrofolate synthase/folylpolyglutamate synthase